MEINLQLVILPLNFLTNNNIKPLTFLPPADNSTVTRVLLLGIFTFNPQFHSFTSYNFWPVSPVECQHTATLRLRNLRFNVPFQHVCKLQAQNYRQTFLQLPSSVQKSNIVKPVMRATHRIKPSSPILQSIYRIPKYNGINSNF